MANKLPQRVSEERLKDLMDKSGIPWAVHEYFMKQTGGGDVVLELIQEVEKGDIRAARMSRTALWRWGLRCISAGTPHAVDPLPDTATENLDRMWAAWIFAIEVIVGEAQKEMGLARDESDDPYITDLQESLKELHKKLEDMMNRCAKEERA